MPVYVHTEMSSVHIYIHGLKKMKQNLLETQSTPQSPFTETQT